MARVSEHVERVDAELDSLAADPDVSDTEYKDALDDIVNRCVEARKHARWTFPMRFLRWLARNWEAEAEFTLDDLVSLREQWSAEGEA